MVQGLVEKGIRIGVVRKQKDGEILGELRAIAKKPNNIILLEDITNVLLVLTDTIALQMRLTRPTTYDLDKNLDYDALLEYGRV